MTAINPARLKLQASELGELIGQPDQFTARLHELLTFYGARIRQTRLSRTPLALQAYQTPEPVIQAIESAIAENLAGNPQAGFPLADRLWAEFWVEFRQLAVHTLGILPTDEPDQILDRIQAWLSDCSSESIRRSIMSDGLARLTREKPDQSLLLIDQLISSGTKGNHQAALFGLELFSKNTSYPNLPLLYRYLSQILMAEESGLVKEISLFLRTLIERSEQEATYFLAQQLGTAYQPRIARVIRQVIESLSQKNRDLLRDKMEHDQAFKQ